MENSDEVEYDTPFSNYREPHRLIEGIDIRDLHSDSGVVFDIYNEYNFDEDENEDLTTDTEGTMYEEIKPWVGTPGETSFEAIASMMTNVDPEGLVKKKMMKSGSGPSMPQYAKVLLHYNLYEESNSDPFDSTYLRGRPYLFCVGSGQVIPGLDMAVRTMRKEENSRFIIKSEMAFRRGVAPRIPKDADILADVTVMDFTSLPVPEGSDALTMEELKAQDFTETLKQAQRLHVTGNEEFKEKRYRGAIAKYSKGLRLLHGARPADEAEDKECNNLMRKIHCNLANSFNHVNKPQQACIECGSALRIDPNYTKAMFMLGRAKLQLNDFSQAKTWLLRAQQRSPNSLEIGQELAKLEKKLADTTIEEKMFCRKFLSNDGSEDEKHLQASEEDLEQFERDLKDAVDQHFTDDPGKPFVFPGELTEDEIVALKRVASALQLKVLRSGKTFTLTKSP